MCYYTVLYFTMIPPDVKIVILDIVTATPDALTIAPDNEL